MKAPLWIDSEVLSYSDAVSALRTVLAGNRPHTVARQIVDTTAGQILLMPAEHGPYAGVKIVTIAPDNPAHGLPRINGIYVLFDAATLVPVAQFDAAALTAVRTAAVSALAVDLLAAPESARLVVFGAGPQAHAHVAAIAAVRSLRSVGVVARTAEKAQGVIERAQSLGLSAYRAESIGDADLVACCTTAREPLFDSADLAGGATVVAVGSHEPDARELDEALMRRATVVVESRASAATAGDVVLAGGTGLVAGDLIDLVAGRVPLEPGRPRVFKSVGEAWEDLAIAAAAYHRDEST
jgi:ornithine cyclodeaminase